MIKSVRTILLIICLQFGIAKISSQNQFEIKLIYSPSYSKLSDDRFEPKFLNSFGIELQKSMDTKLQFGAGVYLRKFGAKFELPPNVTHPQSYEVSYITSSLGIPISIGYYYIRNNNFRAGINVGVENSILLDQKGEKPEGKSEIGIYKSYFIGFYSSLPFGFKLNPEVYLTFEPYWIHQLNNNNSPYKQSILGMNFGVSYILSEH